MNKITRLVLFMMPFAAMSQAPVQKIQSYLDQNRVKAGLTAQDVSGWIVESEGSSDATKINNYYIKQRHNGIEIFSAVTNVWVKNGEVIGSGDRFIPNAATKVNATQPSLSVMEGLTSALARLNVPMTGNFEIIESDGSRNFKISHGALPEDPITAELVYQPVGEDALRLAWDYMFYTPDHKHLWSVRVDALDGKILDKQDLVVSCGFDTHNHTLAASADTRFTKSFFKEESSMLNVQSGSYRVFPFNVESPMHGQRQLLTSPHHPASSPFGWHDTNGIAGAEFTYTRGNNTWAQEDVDANNGTGVSAQGGASLTFDFPYGGNSAQPSTYQNAAMTNLFYMTNIMHDVWFKYGFNEQNGNFQQKNYSGFSQGLLGDALFADAQDGAGENNANFSTPPDGNRPRMQMFLWTVAPLQNQPLHILSPSDIAGPRDARDNSFSPGHVPLPMAPDFIQSELALYNDGTPDIGQTDNADACGPAINASEINGKITIVRRSLAEASGGTPCTFIEKVLNAQNAGATAVIIVNNVEGVIGMSGADASVTIPAISVTQEVGEALIARVKSGTVVGKIQLIEPPFINSDGDFDNGIIAHEFGHGITTRLTGGGSNSNCLSNAEQAGEGWSDWFTLIMTMNPGDVGTQARGIATYVLGQPNSGTGLRSVRYSTDMAINGLTFADSNQGESHDLGEFMATVLWDLTWAYVDKYGYDPDIYNGTGGNNKVMQLVIDALKLQPCNPTFIEYRNAIIAADQATTGGADYCMIWSVFARRGMGVNASSGSRNSATDQVEDFTQPAAGPNCTLSVDHIANEELIRVYPNPSNGMLTIRINQFSSKADIQVVDINGRVVYNVPGKQIDTETTLDLNHLQSGMYILKLSGQSLNYTQKIIIN